ncbi:MAG: ABC transporter ATP-binding protein [Leptolyngbyaceae cyanobacterium]
MLDDSSGTHKRFPIGKITGDRQPLLPIPGTLKTANPRQRDGMLKLHDLSYHPASTSQPILQNLNLQLGPQQLGLVIGPSGSGKTTLLEILAGLAHPTAGEVRWRDQILLPEALQQLAGLVFQFPERHFCGHNILEELRLGHPELPKSRIVETLESVGLGHLSLMAEPHALSGGQQRRLALAVQLIRQPYLLLLDEPTAGLDWSMRRQITSLLKQLKRDWSLLIVTHDAGELTELADRAWTLDHGILKPYSLVPSVGASV